MANEQNLRRPTSKEARENGRKGGKASAKARRERKEMRETFRAILDMPLKPGELEEITTFQGANRLNVTVGEAIALVMASKAVKGDVKAAEFVRDTSGQRPSSAIQVTASSAEASAEFMAMVDEMKHEA